MQAWREVLSSPSIEVQTGVEFEVALAAGEEIALDLRDGRLAWTAGPAPAPDLRIRLHDFDLEQLLFGRLLSREGFTDAEVEANGRRRRALPAPECELAAGPGFEPVAGASLSVGYWVTGTVFGEIGLAERWIDGALVASDLLPPSELASRRFDVLVWCSLGELAALRRRELTPLDAIAGGLGIRGDWPELMCFFELVQHPAYAAAWPRSRDVEAEIAWGALFCSPGYGEAVRAASAGEEAVAAS